MDPKHQLNYHGAYVPSDLPDILSKSDVVVIPSRSESFSYTVREAFHGKVPVIGPNVGAIPEAVVEGRNGLLFEPGNASSLAEKMQYLLDHPDKIDEFRRNIEPVLTVQEQAEKIEKIYWRVLTEGTKRARRRANQSISTGRGHLTMHSQQ